MTLLMESPDGAAATATPSLQRRITLTVLGLFMVLLVVVGVAVDVALGAQLRRELDTRLVDRQARAVSFTEAGAPPQQLPDLLAGRGIRVQVTTPDGARYGDTGLVPDLGVDDVGVDEAACEARPGPPASGAVRPGPGPLGGPPAPPAAPPGCESTSLTETLPDGTEVLLVADTAEINDVRDNLRLIMAIAGIVTLALAAAALVGAIGRALRPLDRLTTLARQITSGDRGRRLHPDRPGTELGRAAAAFDGMLDALETTEGRAHHAALDARAAAEQARRAEAQTRRFLSDAAHELRTPLAGIAAVAEQLANTAATDSADGAGGDPRLARRAQLLLRETGHSTRLVTDMLDLARIDSGLSLQLTDVDLGGLLDAEAERARMLAPALHIDRIGTASLPVRADPMRISQILSNLVNNARRHTPPGGHITLHLDTVATVHLDTAFDDGPGGGQRGAGQDGAGLARVTISDTGPGIPDADRERIFDRLVRLSEARDRDSGGAGLGLAIARGLAHAHRGTLTCLPSPDGAVFELTLPTTPGPQR